MQGDPLEHLLQQADQSIAPPSLQGGLAARVVMRARRQAIRRTIVCGAVALGLIAFGAGRALRSPQPGRQVVEIPTRTVAELRAEVDRLDREAAEHEKHARELALRHVLGDQLAQSQRVLQQTPDPALRINEARDRAALILFRQADSLAAFPQNRAQSQRIYADTARLFPDTPAGRAASRRLAAG